MLPLIAIVGPTVTLHQLLINPLTAAGFPLLIISDLVDVVAVLRRSRPAAILLDMWSYAPGVRLPLLEVLERDVELSGVPRIVVTTEWKNLEVLRAEVEGRGSKLLAYPFVGHEAVSTVRQAVGAGAST
jgi:hypothetical protein